MTKVGQLKPGSSFVLPALNKRGVVVAQSPGGTTVRYDAGVVTRTFKRTTLVEVEGELLEQARTVSFDSARAQQWQISAGTMVEAL